MGESRRLLAIRGEMMSESRIEQLCIDKGMKMTDQRRIIARVLSESEDHPDVEEVHRRSSEIDNRISIATVYRKRASSSAMISATAARVTRK